MKRTYYPVIVCTVAWLWHCTKAPDECYVPAPFIVAENSPGVYLVSHLGEIGLGVRDILHKERAVSAVRAGDIITHVNGCAPSQQTLHEGKWHVSSAFVTMGAYAAKIETVQVLRAGQRLLFHGPRLQEMTSLGTDALAQAIAEQRPLPELERGMWIVQRGDNTTIPYIVKFVFDGFLHDMAIIKPQTGEELRVVGLLVKKDGRAYRVATAQRTILALQISGDEGTCEYSLSEQFEYASPFVLRKKDSWRRVTGPVR